MPGDGEPRGGALELLGALTTATRGFLAAAVAGLVASAFASPCCIIRSTRPRVSSNTDSLISSACPRSTERAHMRASSSFTIIIVPLPTTPRSRQIDRLVGLVPNLMNREFSRLLTVAGPGGGRIGRPIPAGSGCRGWLPSTPGCRRRRGATNTLRRAHSPQ